MCQRSSVLVLVVLAMTLQATTWGQHDMRTEKVKALARTFGYVRYFHPSDQAALLDWESMAYYGTQQTLQSNDSESVRQLIERLFDPVVADLELYEGAEKPHPETKEVPIEQILAWQHLGVGFSGRGPLYSSVRLNRKNKSQNQNTGPFGNLITSLKPEEFKGKKIRYRFDAKISAGRCRLQGWWRVDRASKKRGLFENMSDRPIRSKEWNEYELVGTVDDDATALTIGVMFFGSGSALVDNVRLEQKDGDNWKAIDMPNPDFEKSPNRPEGWINPVQGYSLAIEKKDVTSGKQSVRIGSAAESSVFGDNPIFDMVPELGTVIDAPIAKNLRVRMPLVLSADQKYSKGDNASTDKWIEAVNDVEPESADQSVASIANAILLWNVFQHFYPYFDQIDCDWDSVLETSLKKAMAADSREDATANLQWMVAQLDDGHGRVMDRQQMRRIRFASVRFDWIEDQLVVVASENDDFKAGDIISRIDSKPAEDVLNEREELISGSPQWKRYRSTSELSYGTEDIPVSILRDGRSIDATLEFNASRPFNIEKGDVVRVEVDSDEDRGKIWYIDMGRAEPKDVRGKMKEFAKAKGIVLDFRGYPRGTQFLFQHMTDEHMRSQKWLIPRQVRPDRVDMTDFDKRGRWQMPPLKPRFEGKMVFITNGSAISYAESCMSIVANYKLGEIIGSPTAGANGNVNPFSLPGGYRVAWTGMRVINHDDSQHHVLGVQPTLPMKPTLQGVREGKDELLDKAIELMATQDTQ